MSIYVNGVKEVGNYPEKLTPAVTRWVLPGWYVGGEALSTISAGNIIYIPI